MLAWAVVSLQLASKLVSALAWAAPGDLPGGMHSVGGATRALTEALGGPRHECRHSSDPVDSAHPEGAGHGFRAESSCRYSCKPGGASATSAGGTVTRDAPFNPTQLGLRRGDGNLPFASLSLHLRTFGSRTCVEAATIACGGIDKVQDASFQGMQSGRWKFPAEIPCRDAASITLSPYDSNLGPNALRTAPLDPARSAAMSPIPTFTRRGKFLRLPVTARPGEGMGSPNRPVTRAALIEAYEGELDQTGEDLLRELDANYVDAGACRTRIIASVCYGNCLCSRSDEPKCPAAEGTVLGSPVENQYGRVELCADDFVAEARERGLRGASPDVLDYYCRDFATRSITSQEVPATVPAVSGRGCAAFRGTFDCAAAIQAVR